MLQLSSVREDEYWEAEGGGGRRKGRRREGEGD
jgi:hypothetical protein